MAKKRSKNEVATEKQPIKPDLDFSIDTGGFDIDFDDVSFEINNDDLIFEIGENDLQTT